MVVPVRELHLQHFRGITEASIKLDPRVTVFFGSNAAGKTTVLDALAIGLGAITTRVPNARGRDFAKRGDLQFSHGRTQEQLVGPTPMAPMVESQFSRIAIEGAEGVSWDVTKLRSQQDKASVPAGRGVKAMHEWLDPRIREALDAPTQATSAIPLLAAYGNERAVVDVPLREKNFNRELTRFDALDQALQATTRFKTVFEWFRLMEDQERRDKEQRRDFDYVLPELQWVRRAVTAAELRCRNPRVETKPIRMLVDFERDDGELQPLDITALSDGYRTHFALVVDLARRMVQLNPAHNLNDTERGTNSPAIVLIDEVDLHLDPQWQARVVRGLLAAFPRTQFVLTTHSEQVLASVEASQVRQLSWKDGSIVVGDVPYAQGATGERILVDLMGAPQRVQGPNTEKLERYLRLVEQGRGDESDARTLRAELDRALADDPALHRADLEMQRQSLMSRLAGDAG